MPHPRQTADERLHIRTPVKRGHNLTPGPSVSLGFYRESLGGTAGLVVSTLEGAHRPPQLTLSRVIDGGAVGILWGTAHAVPGCPVHWGPFSNPGTCPLTSVTPPSVTSKDTHTHLQMTYVKVAEESTLSSQSANGTPRACLAVKLDVLEQPSPSSESSQVLRLPQLLDPAFPERTQLMHP